MLVVVGSSVPRIGIVLPAVIGDHMVLQRDGAVVWGWADPGRTITVALAGVSGASAAGDDGRWSVRLDGLAAGGPHVMTISGDGERTVRDVLVGDVWLGAGQSNMEMAAGATTDVALPAGADDCSRIRLFTVPPAASPAPLDDTGGSWQVCDAQTVRVFSAVAYAFGRELQSALHVPLGLIVAAVGSTAISTWTPPAQANEYLTISAAAAPSGSAFVLEIADMHLVPRDPTRPAIPIRLERSGAGVGGEWSAAARAGSQASYRVAVAEDRTTVGRFSGIRRRLDDWASLSTSIADQRRPLDLTGFAAISFRARGNGEFRLGFVQPSIADADYHASQVFGATRLWRTVQIPIDALQQAGWGAAVPFTPGAISGLTITLVVRPPQEPGAAYNAMLRPLTRLRLRGVLWYQGEADAGSAAGYDDRLAALVTGWRGAWDNPRMPFLVVQLPGYADVTKLGVPRDAWAEIREAQREAARIPGVALVTTIDLGEPHRIHPRTKLEVGRRLARAALRLAYGQDVVASGPSPAWAIRGERGALLHFTDVGTTLVTRGGSPLTGFTVSADGRSFVPANARIVDAATVEVWRDEVPRPSEVRYAWADDPTCNLSSSEGFPARRSVPCCVTPRRIPAPTRETTTLARHHATALVACDCLAGEDLAANSTASCSSAPQRRSTRPKGTSVQMSAIASRFSALARKLKRPKPPAEQQRICPYPFARLDVGPSEFVPCCYGWLTDEFYRIPAGDDPWNGPAAVELRARILEGDYRYCKRDVCHRPLYTVDELTVLVESSNEAALSPANYDALKRGEVRMPDGPSGMAMVADPRCNLACPSCRSTKITKLDPYFERQVAHAERLLELYRHDVRSLKMAGNGEVFFSPFLRKVLKEISNETYPSLNRIHILTNGTYMTAETIEKLRPGSDFIQSIVVSIDAGTGEVYREVRGGDWDALVQNLEWVADQRKAGRFPEFGISFTVRTANFRTMPEFVELGNRLGVSWISFSKFTQWGDMGITDYGAEAIHQPEHPLHGELREVAARAASIAQVPVGIFLFEDEQVAA